MPNEFKDIVEYFKKCNKNDFEKLKTVDGNTIIHKMERYLNNKFDFRFNVLRQNVEYRFKNREYWETVDELKENQIYIELIKRDIKCNHSIVSSLLKSEFSPLFHPFIDYFSNLPKWNGHDYISDYCSYIETEDLNFTKQFKKWIVRVVKCATEPNYFNKQVFVIVQAKQNSGKTTWCRNLLPKKLEGYMTQNLGKDKDSKITLCKNLLINLDELEILDKKKQIN